MNDQYQRKINYMRISITDLCNLRCQYCMPETGVVKKKHHDMLNFEKIVEIVKAGTKLGIEKIRFTGGEPLIKRDITRLIAAVSNIQGIRDVSLTTNGLLLAEMAAELKAAGLKRVNISIDSLRPERFKEITRGGDLSAVLAGIEAVKRLDLTPVKLNVVVIRGFNEDEVLDFVNMTREEALDVRFIELMPIGEASGWAEEKFLSNEAIRSMIPGLIPLDRRDSGPADYYRLPGARGRVGFIDPISRHFCDECNRIRLTCDGKVKPCLHSNLEIDLFGLMAQEQLSLEEALERAVYAKPRMHQLYTEDHVLSLRNMSEIGG